MSKLVVFIATFISFTLVCMAQPKFVMVGGDEYNWGEVRPKDSPLKAKIEFRNEGNEDLVILNVRPGCGCTAAKPEKDTLKPGEITYMPVEYSVASNTGVTSKSIRIETNDPKKTTTNYKITANVVRDIICKPTQHLPFKDLKIGVEGSATVYVKNNSDKKITFSDLRIEPAEPQVLKLTIPAKFTLKPGEEIEVTGRMFPKEKGYHNLKIIFKTDHPEYPTFEIPAYGNVAASQILND
jgi:hypothetical protein